MQALATLALEKIKATTRGYVFASRKGIVAAAQIENGRTIVFRRENGRIKLEDWPNANPSHATVKIYSLPQELQCQAAQMLDNL